MPNPRGVGRGRRNVLDGIVARIVAAGVCLAALGFLTFVYLDGDEAAVGGVAGPGPSAAAYQACVAAAHATIDHMEKDAGLSARQVSLFKRNAEGRCRDQSTR